MMPELERPIPELERPIPEDIGKWNWGAFILTWIWGLGNNTYIALLWFVPFVNWVVPFYLGFKGNELAWKNKQWQSLEHFKQTQKKWAIAGLIVVIVSISFIFVIVFAVMGSMRNMDVVNQSVTLAGENNEVVKYIGKPITKGYFISGNVQISGYTGTANLAAPIKGPKGEGTIYVEAIKDMGQWKIQRMVVEIGEGEKRIDVVGQSQRQRL